METVIALIWNTNDVYDRHWIRSNGNESEEAFINRINACYSHNSFRINFYYGEHIDA